MKAFYKLTPAYRHGESTPWGGSALKALFGKDIPDDHTGESLEASTLSGLESTLADGTALSSLTGGPLPLLLKLIDAREALSVQVHPDDSYARVHENGKLGKTEAWLILDAKPGASLVYGLMPDTDLSSLTGQDIEAKLRWMPAQKGDVFLIPAGMVHAIGAGIVLYEIQQASDVTYRFWDWDRRDADGNARELHWKKACAVSRPDLQLFPTRGETASVEGGTHTHYLTTPFFSLDRYQVPDEMRLPSAGGFQYITALQKGSLRHGNDALSFAAGDTIFIPAGSEGIVASGPCDLLISSETAL